jgi:uncharacterized cupin superfamily protein
LPSASKWKDFLFGGEPVTFGKGDLVVFPQGMSCTWNVQEAVRKHYQFGE